MFIPILAACNTKIVRAMKYRHFKERHSRRLYWQILQELAETDLEAHRLIDQNEEASRVLQRELDSPESYYPSELKRKEEAGERHTI